MAVAIIALLGWLGLSKSATAQQKIYWADRLAGEVHRSNLDGSDVQIVTFGLGGAWGVAVDPFGGRLYWTDTGTHEIFMANLGGSNPRVIASDTTSGWQIAVDPGRHKLYWTSGGKVSRANLDGSGYEIIYKGDGSPAGIAIDTVAGKVYWTDTGLQERIRRANLDGSEMEDLISYPSVDLSNPEGLALDTKRRKMYWTDRDRIRRANLDGTVVEDVLTIGIGMPWGIAIDVEAAKLYWTDSFTRTIKRSNLDGSAVETLVSQYLRWPVMIALDLRPHLSRVLTQSPSDGEVFTSMTPTLSWHGLSGAARYVVQVFSDTVLSQQALSDTTTETSITFEAPSAGSEYFWRVRGMQPGESGPWSAVRRFTIREEFQAVTLLDPDDGAEGLSGLPTLVWEATTGASRYRLQIAQDASFANALIDDSTLTEPSFGPDEPLEYSTRYYWRVRAGDDLGWGPWSEVWLFTTGTGVTSETLHEVRDLRFDVYPNPVAGIATISLETAQALAVSVAVWDVDGKLVDRIYRGSIGPGETRFRWAPSHLSPGLYFVSLVVPERTIVEEVVVL